MLLIPLALAFGVLPQDQPVLLGVIGSTVGGLAGAGAFAAAVGLRIRSLRPFGFKPAANRWIMIAIGLGLACYGLNLIIQSAYVSLIGYDDPQGILHAAAQGGALPFILSLLGGAVFTPFGKEELSQMHSTATAPGRALGSAQSFLGWRTV